MIKQTGTMNQDDATFLANELMQWHEGQGDVLYAVGSLLNGHVSFALSHQQLYLALQAVRSLKKAYRTNMQLGRIEQGLINAAIAIFGVGLDATACTYCSCDVDKHTANLLFYAQQVLCDTCYDANN